MEEIFIIICRNKNREDWTTVGVSQECYKDIEKAIEFCRGRLNKEELEKHDKLIKKNMIQWYEFDSKDYVYEIKVLSLK